MLLFVRHGQSVANEAGLLLGRADSPLTDLGRAQADALGAALALRAPEPCRIVTSPLQRARATADLIASRYTSPPPPVPDERFIELDYGELDERALAEVPAGIWESWQEDCLFRPRDGESLMEVMTRVSAACDELATVAAKRDVVIVSHVSPIKAAVAWALGCGVEVTWHLSLSVASITSIATGGPRGPSLVGFNETGHLTAPRG